MGFEENSKTIESRRLRTKQIPETYRERDGNNIL